MRIALLVLLIAGRAAAAPAPQALAGEPTSLLEYQFTIRLPQNMKVVPNVRDSRGLAMPRGVSTRAELVESAGRLVMVASDTYTVVGRDFRAAVRSELALIGVSGARLAEAKLGRGIVFVHPPLTGGDARLIHAAYIRGYAGQVFVIAFYAFGDLLDDIEDWARIARWATATIVETEAGPSISRRGAMTVGESVITLDVPDGWAIHGLYGTGGTGGLVLRQTVQLGQPAGSCSLDDTPRDAPATATAARIRLLGIATTWRTWWASSRAQSEVELVVGQHHVRVACTAPTVERLRGAQRIVGEMTLQ